MEKYSVVWVSENGGKSVLGSFSSKAKAQDFLNSSKKSLLWSDEKAKRIKLMPIKVKGYVRGK